MAELQVANSVSGRAQMRLMSMAVVTPLMVALVWADRGAVFGMLALLVWAPLMGISAFNHQGFVAWSERNPVLDGALFVPVLFFGLLVISSAPVGDALVGTAVLGAGYVVWSRWRAAVRANAAPRTPTASTDLLLDALVAGALASPSSATVSH